MKKLIPVVLTIIIAGLFLLSTIDNDGKEINKIFKDTGAQIIETTIEGSGIGNINDSETQIIKILSGCLRTDSFKKDSVNGLSIYSNNNFTIKIRKLYAQKNTYISISYSQDKQLENINNVKRTISKAFSYYKLKPSFSFLFKGKYAEKKSLLDVYSTMENTIIMNRVKNSNCIFSGNVISAVGYLPEIKEKVVVDEKLYNINIAARYSKSDGCTYLLIGCPFIAVEY